MIGVLQPLPDRHHASFGDHHHRDDRAGLDTGLLTVAGIVMTTPGVYLPHLFHLH